MLPGCSDDVNYSMILYKPFAAQSEVFLYKVSGAVVLFVACIIYTKISCTSILMHINITVHIVYIH